MFFLQIFMSVQLFLMFLSSNSVNVYCFVIQAKIAQRQKSWQRSFVQTERIIRPTTTMALQYDSENDDELEDTESSIPPVNPYADPNYPDLEFVNYDDPEYSIDRSLDVGNDMDGTTITDETLLEQMREERRVSNDIYQYNTYYHTVWNAGSSTYRGEWTIYYSSTFFPQFDDDTDTYGTDGSDDTSLPRLIQVSDAPVTVISRAILQNSSTTMNNDNEPISSPSFITHIEALEEGMGDMDLAIAGGADETERQVVAQTYWPEELYQTDFRGHQGIMICGNAYTICTSVPLNDTPASDEIAEGDYDSIGPFSEYRVELGICANDEARFRIKLDYSVLPSDIDSSAVAADDISSPPSLHLKTMVVCREAADKWPRSSIMAQSLFGTPPGAPGGLYDPPPIGSLSRSEQYCLVDFDGSATALIPIIIDQIDINDDGGENPNDTSFDSNNNDDRLGWVTSLDWTAGGMRYQVDRKVHNGRHIRGLRTLELSEVQGVDADRYRPRDNGQNLRQ